MNKDEIIGLIVLSFICFIVWWLIIDLVKGLISYVIEIYETKREQRKWVEAVNYQKMLIDLDEIYTKKIIALETELFNLKKDLKKE